MSMSSQQLESSPGNSLLAALDATGVPATIKGKVQRTILRFIAGGIGFEAWQEIREKLDTIDGRSRINMMLAEHIGRQAIADPEIVNRAKARFLGDLARKQENLEAVALLANEAIEADPDAEQASESAGSEPSQDWMNAFIREAENASSDDLRQRLAGVLSGEAKNPGTFSRSTVRFISEVEKETLEYFQDALLYRFSEVIYIDDSWKSGKRFVQGSALEDAGLISGVTGTTHMSWNLNSEGSSLLWSNGIGIVFEGRPDLKIKVNCWIITKLGLEVSSLLNSGDGVLAADQFGKVSPKTDLNCIWFGGELRKPDGELVGVSKFRVVWDKSDPQTEAI